MLTSKDDLSLSTIKILIEDPLEFDPREVPEPYTQYVRHFIYMVKRNERQGNEHLGYGKDADGSLSSPKKRNNRKTSETEPRRENSNSDSDLDDFNSLKPGDEPRNKKPSPNKRAKKSAKKKSSPKKKAK